MQMTVSNWLTSYKDSFSPEEDLSFIQENVPLKTMTSFHVGGPARVVIAPPNKEMLAGALKSLNECGIRPVILGRGSNVVASDEGYDGVVIRLSDTMNTITVELETGGEADGGDAGSETKDKVGIAANGGFITAQAGASLAALSKTAQQHGLTGLEFASGIPGAVGGGLYMNAGAYGGELAKVLVEAEVMTLDGAILTIPVEDLDMSYRHTRFMKEDWIIVSGTFRLKKGDGKAILEEMNHLNAQRREKQPLEYPSCGSFFKRPVGYFAGKLIQDAGLKGARVGDAMVSEKHAGFLINVGNATEKDIQELMHQVQTTVFEQFGVRLEAEAKYLSPRGFEPFV